MYKKIIGYISASFLLLACALPAFAEDIDLFSAISSTNDDPPTVLIGWHSTANSNANVEHGCLYPAPEGEEGEAPSLGDTVAGMEQCALVRTLESLKESEKLLGGFKLGLMLFNQNSFSSHDNRTEDGQTFLGNGDNTCGYLYVRPKLMLEAADINAFIDDIKALDKSDLANQSRLGDLVAESWAMLNGLSTSCSGVNYSSLSEIATECRDAVLIYLGNATKETSSVADGTGDPDDLLFSQLKTAFGYGESSSEYKLFSKPRAVTLLNNSGSDNNKYWGDEWSRFMNLVDVNDSAQADRNVVTYSIAVYDPALEGKLAGEINFLADMASQGGGRPFKVKFNEYAKLQEAFAQIFNEVQDVNSVFSSATLPVSANTQGTFLNQVYIAMFRPDANGAPRWNGNVKQYQLGFDLGGNLVLTDSTQDTSNAVTSVTNPISGAIKSDAVSFWTTNTPKTVGESGLSNTTVSGWPEVGFWINSPEGDAFTFDSPDGDLVEKGGAAQMLRVDNLLGSTERTVYTCNDIGACESTMTSFDTANASVVSKIDSAIDAVQEGGSASLVVGDEAVVDVETSCVNRDKTCTITFTSDIDLTFDPDYDRIVVVGGWNSDLRENQQVCGSASPCTIVSVNDSSIVVLNKSIPADNSYAGITLKKLSRLASVSQSGHGFLEASEGKAVGYSDCSVSDTSATENIDALTGTISGASIVEVIDTENYTIRLSDFLMAPASAGVTCGGSATLLTADSLIDWFRGDDIVGNEAKKGPCPPDSRDADCPISARGSIHGDVLHSRPAVINYSDHGVVVFYGSNDGHFRAINGNQSKTIGSVRPGGELWSFVAPEFFEKLPRLYENSPAVKYPGTPDAVKSAPRGYFFDGTTTVLKDDREGTDTSGEAYLFLSARRGGRLIYALNVSDPTAPEYAWSLSNADIPELGQTWSQPKVTVLKHYDNPVLVFGGGYDPAEDEEPASGINTMGRAIFIVDALSGDLLWSAQKTCSEGLSCTPVSGMDRSIPADITLVDRDIDGFTDRLYAADVGGNIWRVDLEDGSTEGSPFGNVPVTQLADLGGAGNDARKFLFAPDVVPTNNYDAVVAVSGDREHPLYTSDSTAGLAYNVQNRFYMIMDKNIGKSVPDDFVTVDHDDLINQSAIQCVDAGGTVVSCSDADVETSLYFDGLSDSFAGYYINLMTGEKGVNAPLAVAGKVYFGTNQPDVPAEGSCTANLGNAGAYIIDLVTGETQRNIFSGGGLPPSPIAGLVTIDGKTVPFIIGGAGPSPFDPIMPSLNLPPDRKRTFWYFK